MVEEVVNNMHPQCTGVWCSRRWGVLTKPLQTTRRCLQWPPKTLLHGAHFSRFLAGFFRGLHCKVVNLFAQEQLGQRASRAGRMAGGL